MYQDTVALGQLHAVEQVGPHGEKIFRDGGRQYHVVTLGRGNASCSGTTVYSVGAAGYEGANLISRRMTRYAIAGCDHGTREPGQGYRWYLAVVDTRPASAWYQESSRRWPRYGLAFRQQLAEAQAATQF